MYTVDKYTPELQTYGDYRPTQWDSKGAYLREQGDWLVAPFGQNRDSKCYEQSNFDTAVSELGGESETVEVHRFGHWACGWFEIIIVKPNTKAHRVLVKLADSAAIYPLLNEDDATERECAAAWEYWDSLPMADKVDMCRDEGVSIFAARDFPEEVEQSLREEV